MKKIIIFFVLTSIVFILGACGGNEANTNAEGDEKVVLKFAHVLAPDHPYNKGAEKFKEVLEEGTSDQMSVEIYPGAELGSERDLTEGMQLGTIDIAIVPGTISSFEPKMGALDLPYLFKDREHAYEVLDGEIGQKLAEDLPSKDLRLLSYWENGFRHVTNSSKPVNTPEDLEGLKIRIPENDIYVNTFKDWGANVTTMAFGELYTALQQKTVDAQENPLALISTNKFFEAQEYLSLTGHFYGPAHVIISEHTWQSLTPEQQEQVMKAAEEARDYERELLKKSDEEYLESLKEEGMKINEVDQDAFQEAAKPIWEMYEDQYGEIVDEIQSLR